MQSSIFMILQKSFNQYADLLLKKHFLLLSMLQAVMLLCIFVEIVIFFSLDSLTNRKFKITLLERNGKFNRNIL